MRSEDETRSSRRYYDDVAWDYDHRRFSDEAGRHVRARQAELVRELLGDAYAEHALEIGPGTGRFTRAIADLSKCLTVVDLSKEMIAQAAKHVPRDVTLVQGSLVNLPFPDSTFDLVFSVNVLTHVRDLDQAVAEMSRVASPGGRVIVSITNARSLFMPAALVVNRRGRAFGENVSSTWHSLGRLSRAGERAALHVTEIRGMYYTPGRLRSSQAVQRIVRRLDGLAGSPSPAALARHSPWLVISMIRGSA